MCVSLIAGCREALLCTLLGCDWAGGLEVSIGGQPSQQQPASHDSWRLSAVSAGVIHLGMVVGAVAVPRHMGMGCFPVDGFSIVKDGSISEGENGLPAPAPVLGASGHMDAMWHVSGCCAWAGPLWGAPGVCLVCVILHCWLPLTSSGVCFLQPQPVRPCSPLMATHRS